MKVKKSPRIEPIATIDYRIKLTETRIALSITDIKGRKKEADLATEDHIRTRLQIAFKKAEKELDQWKTDLVNLIQRRDDRLAVELAKLDG